MCVSPGKLLSCNTSTLCVCGDPLRVCALLFPGETTWHFSLTTLSGTAKVPLEVEALAAPSGWIT